MSPTRPFYLIWQTKTLNNDWLSLNRSQCKILIVNYLNRRTADLERWLLSRDLMLFSLEEIRSNPSTRDFICENLNFKTPKQFKRYKTKIKKASVKKLSSVLIKTPEPSDPTQPTLSRNLTYQDLGF